MDLQAKGFEEATASGRASRSHRAGGQHVEESGVGALLLDGVEPVKAFTQPPVC